MSVRRSLNDLKSKPSAHGSVLFYASVTCPHCRAELDRWRSSWEQRREQLGRLNLVVIAPAGSATLAASVSPLVVSALDDSAGTLRRALGVSVVPTILFVDVAGLLRVRLVGEQTHQAVDRALTTLDGGLPLTGGTD